MQFGFHSMPSIYSWDRILQTPADYDFNSTVIRAHEKVPTFFIPNYVPTSSWILTPSLPSSITQPNLSYTHGQQMMAKCSLPLGSQDITLPRTSLGTIIPSWHSGRTPLKVYSLNNNFLSFASWSEQQCATLVFQAAFMASEIHYYRLGASRGENNMGKFIAQRTMVEIHWHWSSALTWNDYYTLRCPLLAA
jgi:beta-mannosidase